LSNVPANMLQENLAPV